MQAQRRQSGLKSGGSRSQVQKILTFPGKFPENFDFFRQFKIFLDFPGKNWPFPATSGQISLFLFKTHHFQTHFLYMIRYNNISRPIHDNPRPLCEPPRPPCPKSGGVATPKSPRIDAPVQAHVFLLYFYVLNL